MAKYLDKSQWEDQILIPDEQTPILGGQPDWDSTNMLSGWSNVPAGMLANRTRFLLDKILEVEQGSENSLQKDNNLSDLQDAGQAKFNLGLNLVDNVRDVDKPVSTATQTALNSKVDKVEGKGLSTEDFTSAEKGKLAGLENFDDSAIQAELSDKVDKEVGKGLSDVNFTEVYKQKLEAVEEHYKGLFTDEASLIAGVTSPVAGDYADVDAAAGQDVSRYIWDVNDSKWVKQSGDVAPITSAQVKTLYEANADTNAFTDAEKSKLGGVQAGANNYTLPTATASVLGGVQIGTNLTASGGVIGVANGSTAVKGVVQLNDTLTSTATDQAVTAAQAKVLKDLVDTKVGTQATKAQVLTGAGGTYVSGSTYHNIITWNDLGSVSTNTIIDLDTSLNHKLTATASLTIDASNNDAGKTGDIIISTPTAVTISWNTKWKFLGKVPNIGGAGETWVVSYKVFDASNIYASASKVA